MHLANSLLFLICTLFVVVESGQTNHADSLSQFVNKMTTLARLTNGIVLEKGLMDGSIPSDDVISEFLHMGNLTIDELLNLGTVQLNKSFTEFHHLSENLVSSKDVEAVESRFEIINEIRNLALHLGNITSLPGLEDYKESMSQLVAIPLDGKELDKLFTKFNDFEKRIENITEMEVPATSTEKNKAMAEIKKTIGMYIEFEKEVNAFNDFYEKIASLKLLDKLNTSFLDPLDEEMELRQKYITESTSGVRIKLDLVRNNLEQFLNSSIIFQNTQGLVSPVQRLISARLDTQNWNNTYSIGLPNGPIDFQNISIATNDIKSLISNTDSDWVSEHLSRSLNPIINFGRNISSIHDSWANLSTIDDLNSVVRASGEIAKYANEKDTILQLMEAFEDCDKFSENETSKVQSIDKINDLRSAASELYQVFSGFISFDYLKNMPSSKKLFPRYKTWYNLTNVTLPKLQSLPSWKRSKVALEHLKEDFPEFKKNVTMVQEAIEKLNPILIEEYLKSLEDSGFLNFYSSLKEKIRGKEEDGKIILDLLKELSDFRRNATNYKIQEVIDVVGTLFNSLEDLKSLKGYGEEMKNVEELEAVALRDSDFQDSRNFLNKLAKAVQGLQAIREVFVKREELEDLVGDISFIKTSAESYNASLKPEEIESLSKIENLKTVLSELFFKIDDLNEKIGKLAATTFGNFTPIFEAAHEIPDVTEDVKSLVSALTSLSNLDVTLQENITKILGSLNSFESLDLKFSAYEISSGSEALEALDLLFSSFRTKIPPAPTTPNTTPQITTIRPVTSTLSAFPSTVMALGLNQTANTMPEWQIGLIVAIGLITAALIFTIVSYCRKWFCFKNKKSKSAKSENDISFILPPVPPVASEESLYVPPPSMYQPAPNLPPPPPSTNPKKDPNPVSIATAHPGPSDFPPAQWTVEATQDETKTKTVEEGPKSKEVVASGSKESVSKGSASKSKEDVKMKPSQEVM
ncbi:hypothetical protein B9Z55_009886 [Caenorhabditis nigoni]|uniref:Domain of unknown function WSN domain-containing protein n=1 Tax=Caenorhabditis nigoni TaxID=1611254 RepID=A0A2G5UTW9_9PELO|nr:hypothetical protein B9Z55_009886 [Caenorhabditis nigoni]